MLGGYIIYVDSNGLGIKILSQKNWTNVAGLVYPQCSTAATHQVSIVRCAIYIHLWQQDVT